MNTLVFTLVLLAMGTVMALVAFGSVYGIATILQIGTDVVDARITFTFFILSCVVIYGISFGAFTGIQKDSCGEVKSWKQIALNATIPLAFHAGILAIVLLIPWFQNLVGNLFAPDTPAYTKTAMALAYYSFWAALMGGALGGTLSGSCKAELPFDPNFLDKYTPSTDYKDYIPKEVTDFAKENKEYIPDVGVNVLPPE